MKRIRWSTSDGYNSIPPLLEATRTKCDMSDILERSVVGLWPLIIECTTMYLDWVFCPLLPWLDKEQQTFLKFKYDCGSFCLFHDKKRVKIDGHGPSTTRSCCTMELTPRYHLAGPGWLLCLSLRRACVLGLGRYGTVFSLFYFRPQSFSPLVGRYESSFPVAW